MDYAEAIADLTARHGIGGLKDPFFFRCAASDLVGASSEAKRLLDALYALQGVLDLVSVFERDGLEGGRRAVMESFALLKGEFSKAEIVAAVNPLAFFLCPGEFSKKGVPSAGPRAKRGVARIVKKAVKASGKKPIRVDSKQAKPNPSPKAPAAKKRPICAKKPAKGKLISLRKICISTNASYLYLHPGQVSSLQVEVDGKQVSFDYRQFVDGPHSIDLPLNAPGKSIVLTFPEKRYDSLIVYGNGTAISGMFVGNSCGFDDLYLESKDNSVFFDGDCRNATILASLSSSVSGTYENADIRLSGGDLYFALFPHKKKRSNIRVDVKKGRFKGKFFPKRLPIPHNNPFRKRTQLSCQITRPDIKLNLEVNAAKGISIR